MDGLTFKELLCKQRGLTPEQYTDYVLRRALYPHARWTYYFVRFFRPEHFVADTDLIGSVATLKSLRGYHVEVDKFINHPGSDGWLRRVYNFRVSTKRLRRLIRATLYTKDADGVHPPEEDHTLAPFSRDKEKS